MKNSDKGFATIVLLSLLPLLVVSGLALFTTFGFLKSDLATMNLCRAEQIKVQNKVGQNLAKLMTLNQKAMSLRLAEARAQKKLAVAVNSGFAPAIAAAEANLLSVQLRRQTLHLRQRTLIETANVWLKSGSSNLQNQLRQEWWRHNGGLISWLKNSLQLKQADVPELAVRADIPEIAPVYQLKTNFAESQAWKQSWSFQFTTTNWAAKFFNFDNNFERSCTTSLYPKGNQWIAKIKKDKSLLKAFL